MSVLLDLELPVISFIMDEENLILLSGKDLIKADKENGCIRARKTIFIKEGNSRALKGNSSAIVVSDFCMLSLYDQSTFEKIGEWKLGEDLSSDICGLFIDDTYAYASIRNGRIARIHLETFDITEYEISSTSAWAFSAYQDKIIAGTVGGELLLFEKETMKCSKRIQLGRQNLRSLYI